MDQTHSTMIPLNDSFTNTSETQPMVKQNLEFLVYFLTIICPPIIILSGIVANISVIAVYSRTRFRKDPTRNLWRLLAIVDFFCVNQQWKHFINHVTDGEIEIETISSISCKISAYTSHMYSISAWLLVFISVDRFFSIVNLKVSQFIQRRSVQIITCSLIFLVNIAFFSQSLIYIDIQPATDNKLECTRVKKYSTMITVFYYIDMVISAILPYAVMSFCSFYLIYTIHRQQSFRFFSSTAEKKRQQRDLKFSIRILTMAVLFLLCNLPISIFYVADLSNCLVFYVLDDLYYFGFVVNFFVYYCVHSVFRNEFLLMIKWRKTAGNMEGNRSTLKQIEMKMSVGNLSTSMVKKKAECFDLS